MIRPAILLRTGNEPELDPAFEVSLDNLQRVVGGHVDFAGVDPLIVRQLENRLGVDLGDRRYLRLVVHDEGLLHHLPENPVATLVHYGMTPRGIPYPVVGDCVLVEVD